MRYTATIAGGCELHIWSETKNEGARTAFPGSPYHLTATAGRASPAASLVDGWVKVFKEEKGDKHGKHGSDTSALHAGDMVALRPQVFDEDRNPAQLPEGAMKVLLQLPDGTELEVQCTQQVKSGQTTYDVRHDTSIAGLHQVHISLFDTPIVGSPVSFNVVPDKPDPLMCKLVAPSEDILIVDREYACMIKCFDRFGNKSLSGGLSPQVRSALMKQGVHDQTALVPSNHTLSQTAEDLHNGEYLIRVGANIPVTFKVHVNIDKNIPSAGGELPPVSVQFHDDPNGAAKEMSLTAPGGAARKKPVERLKQAGHEVMQGFGSAEERRDKDALVVAAEAFADGSAFAFDNAGLSADEAKAALDVEIATTDSPKKSPTKGSPSPSQSRRFSVKEAWQQGSVVSSSVLTEEGNVVSPNMDLFDRTPPTPSPGKNRRGSVTRRASVSAGDGTSLAAAAATTAGAVSPNV